MELIRYKQDNGYYVANEYIDELVDADFCISSEVGGSDFEIETSAEQDFETGDAIAIPHTEVGGLIERKRENPTTNTITYSGRTWRGILDTIILEPPQGEDYASYTEGTNFLHYFFESTTLGDMDTLFMCGFGDEAFEENYQFQRYKPITESIYLALEDLTDGDKKLAIATDEVENGRLRVSLKIARRWSESYPIGGSGIDATITDDDGGINHLICLGRGELAERKVIHLYADERGKISSTPTFVGDKMRTEVYDYASAESTKELRRGGRKRLKEIMSRPLCEVKNLPSENNLNLFDMITIYDTERDFKAFCDKAIYKLDQEKHSIEKTLEFSDFTLGGRN